MNYQPNQTKRLIYLSVYICLLFLTNYILFGQWIPLLNAKGLWLYSGLLSLLLGNLIVTPYFTSPANAISYSAAAIIAIITLPPNENIELYYLIIGLCSFIIFASFLNILFKNSKNTIFQNLSNTSRIIADYLGSPRVLYSLILFYILYVFHSDSSKEVILITLTGLLIIFKVLEGIDWIFNKIFSFWIKKIDVNIVGEIVAYQTPNIILLRLIDGKIVKKNDCLIISDSNYGNKLSIVLGFSGRDEGILIRVLEFSLPSSQTANELMNEISKLIKHIPTNFAGLLSKSIFDKLKTEVDILKKIDHFVGIVDVDTDIENLYIEIINEEKIEEGKLLEVDIKGENVLYQLMDGLTKEEIVIQKNKFGYAKGNAKKIGKWNTDKLKFENVKWLPTINSPVFLKIEDTIDIPSEAIGNFPSTNYFVTIKDYNQLVTHNTAILGILGIGKSMLSIEIIERLIDQRIKVLCLDLTNQYNTELKAFVDEEKESESIKKIVEAGEKDKDAWKDNPEEGGSIINLRAALLNDIKEFIDDGNSFLKIYNPMLINGSKQIYDPKSFAIDGKWFRNASLWSLTPVEITQIITESVLLLLQGEMTDKAKLCLVFEEAHSLIPEWGSFVNEGDKQATSGTVRAILQGRKYGLGCIVVSQRTANVTKSILNQCNTIFAMRTFDDTGKGFLSNYIGNSYTEILPTIGERHAVFFGRSSSCENPVLIRLNDRDKFIDTFRKS